MKNTYWLRRAAVMLLAAACSAPSYGRDVGLGDWRLAKGAVREGDLLTIDSSVGGPNCNAFAEVDLSPCADVVLDYLEEDSAAEHDYEWCFHSRGELVQPGAARGVSAA